jgi:hypothetical protein
MRNIQNELETYQLAKTPITTSKGFRSQVEDSPSGYMSKYA